MTAYPMESVLLGLFYPLGLNTSDLQFDTVLHNSKLNVASSKICVCSQIVFLAMIQVQFNHYFIVLLFIFLGTNLKKVLPFSNISWERSRYVLLIDLTAVYLPLFHPDFKPCLCSDAPVSSRLQHRQEIGHQKAHT